MNYFRKFLEDTQNAFEEIDQSVLQSISHYKQRNEMQQLEQKLMDLRLANKQQKVVSFGGSKNENAKVSSESSTEAPIQQSKQESYSQENIKHEDMMMNAIGDDNGGPNSIAKKILQQNSSPHKRGEKSNQSNSAVVVSSNNNSGKLQEIDTDDKAMGLSDFKYDLVFDDDQNQENEDDELQQVEQNSDDDDDGEQQC